MPVIDSAGKLVGIVTEGDFLRRSETHTEAPRRRWLELLQGPASGADEYARSHGCGVREVMSTKLVTVAENTPLRDVAALMEEYGIKRIPVIDQGGKVAGIVSRADLMSALAEVLSESKQVPADDQSIRRIILAQMKRQPWCPVQSLSVRVRGGYVDLSGTIFEERQRRALHCWWRMFKA
jgi:Mg/Co/Ni transporter MgtE